MEELLKLTGSVVIYWISSVLMYVCGYSTFKAGFLLARQLKKKLDSVKSVTRFFLFVADSQLCVKIGASGKIIYTVIPQAFFAMPIKVRGAAAMSEGSRLTVQNILDHEELQEAVDMVKERYKEQSGSEVEVLTAFVAGRTPESVMELSEMLVE